MSIFDLFGGVNNMMTMFQTFAKNPMQYLISQRLSVPQNIQNDPQAIVRHLMNSGQMSQEQFNQLNQYAKQLQNKYHF